MVSKRKTRYESFRTLEQFSLFDLELVRLILRGGNVLDWHRLNLSRTEAKAFCRVHNIDLNNPDHIALVNRIQNEAVVYLRETLAFPIPKPVRTASILDLFAMAGDTRNRHRQFCACTLLKAMHIINYFDASEARRALEMTDKELFQVAEQRIYRTISNMMAQQLPVVEFMGGRKKRSSVLTKLLSKRNPLTAQLYDKLRFRIITDKKEDIFPVINYLARNLFPLNYVLAGESYNTLIPFVSFCKEHEHLNPLANMLQLDSELENQLQPLANKHSSPDYRVVHWVTHMPILIPNWNNAFRTDGVDPIPRPIVYLGTELQIMDSESHYKNERGDASHGDYKDRQRKTVASRLKVGSLKRRGTKKN